MDREAIALKMDLTNQGVRIGDDLVAEGFGLALAISGEPGASEGLDLVLPGDWTVSVSVAPGYARTSPYALHADPDRPSPPGGVACLLRHRTRPPVPVTVPVTARFRHDLTASGRSCGEVGSVHGSWLVVAPWSARDAAGLDRPRRWLGLPTAQPWHKASWTVDEVVAAVEAAWNHAGVRQVHLECSHIVHDDGGVAQLAPYIAAIRRAAPVLVSVSVAPPVEADRVLDLYAAGCDSLAYHLLAWDEAAAAGVSPLRTRFVPHARTQAALDAAVRFLPRGAVSTDLLLGIEPLERVAEAIDALTARGVVPNLALFRPLPGAEDDAPHGELVPTEAVLDLSRRRLEAMARHGLAASRVRGFPRTVSGADRYAPGRLDRWYAALRRAVRVEREQ